MDIKNDFENYEKTVQAKIKIEQIKKTINLIITSNIEYEFRTTIYPKHLDTKNCEEIAKYLGQEKAQNYVLQQYNMVENLDVIPYSKEKLEQICSICNKYINTKLRGI